MNTIISFLTSQSALSMSLMRVVLGLILAFAGYAKIFKSNFGVNAMRHFDIPLPELMGPIISILELGGGILLAVGLFTRYLGALFTIQFVVASLLVISSKGLMGARLELVILVAAFALASNGGGSLSAMRQGHRLNP